jgi:NADPH:quinone reductase-like Zn-dependent oxidoreductase
VGNHSLLAFRRVLKPTGIYVLIGGGGPDDGKWIGPMARPVKALLMSPFVSQELGMLLASINKDDLTVMKELMEAGKVTPVIDRSYALRDAPEAIRYLEEGHARGKVIITLDQEG